jgi:hypothetical protein
MTFHQFQDFVAGNIDWFRGRMPETDSSLKHAELSLGVELPSSVKWLLKEHGYWHGTGVSNLEDAVKDTLDARHHLALPGRFVVLDNFQDGGIILIDTGEETSSGEFAMYWVGMQDLGKPPRLEGNTRYDSFGDYVKDQLLSKQDCIEPRFVRYDPAEFPEGRGDG